MAEAAEAAAVEGEDQSRQVGQFGLVFAGQRRVAPARAALVALVTSVSVAVLLPFLVDVASAGGAALRGGVALGVVALVGLGIGSPLAAFLRSQGEQGGSREVSAWIWATNGLASVLAAVLALILASSLGLRATALSAAVAYGVAALAMRRYAERNLL